MNKTSGKSWLETQDACEVLGLKPKQLRQLRTDGLFKAGKHYRVKNPRVARSHYLWNVDAIASLLTPIN